MDIRTMGGNKLKCIVGGQLGLVTASYTHTMDVYLFKNKKSMTGVHRRYVRLLPLEAPKKDRTQLCLEL